VALLGEIGEGNLQKVFDDLSNFRKGILIWSNEEAAFLFEPHGANAINDTGWIFLDRLRVAPGRVLISANRTKSKAVILHFRKP
jgi:hypothetical protein